MSESLKRQILTSLFTTAATCFASKSIDYAFEKLKKKEEEAEESKIKITVKERKK